MKSGRKKIIDEIPEEKIPKDMLDLTKEPPADWYRAIAFYIFNFQTRPVSG